MTVTSTQLIYKALRDIGCLRAGQTTSADILSDGLAALNEHIDTDLLDPSMRFAFRPDIYTLTAGLQTYQIGPSQVAPNFNAPRPTDIHGANVILNTFSPSVRMAIFNGSVDDWRALRVQQLPNAIPQMMWYDQNFDPTGQFGTIRIWPGPLTTYQLELYTHQQLQQFPDLVTSLNWPPGYVNYLRKSLAIELAPSMAIHSKLGRLAQPQQPMLQLVAKQAKEARDLIEAKNSYVPTLRVDGAFAQGSHGSPWNYATGESSR